MKLFRENLERRPQNEEAQKRFLGCCISLKVAGVKRRDRIKERPDKYYVNTGRALISSLFATPVTFLAHALQKSRAAFIRPCVTCLSSAAALPAWSRAIRVQSVVRGSHRRDEVSRNIAYRHDLRSTIYNQQLFVVHVFTAISATPWLIRRRGINSLQGKIKNQSKYRYLTLSPQKVSQMLSLLYPGNFKKCSQISIKFYFYFSYSIVFTCMYLLSFLWFVAFVLV